MQPAYEHTQKAPLHLMLWCIGIVIATMGVVAEERIGTLICFAVAILMLLFAAMFRWMTVRDEGACLAVRYGPLPVFKARFPYREMTDVQQAKSSFLDGWGIHYFPGRGWTYNLWGFDCVKMLVNGVAVRIGSDDVVQLVEFLQAKTASQGGTGPSSDCD